MCIVLCPNSSLHCLPVYLSFALSSLFSSPPKMRGLILRRKTGTVSVEVFTFRVHLAFERHTGTEGREPLLSCSVYFVRIPLSFELIFCCINVTKYTGRLTSKRLLFWCYSPCSEDSEKDSCSNKIKTTCCNWFLLFAAHAGIEKDTVDWWSRLFLLYNSSQCLAICNVLALATTSCSVQYGYEIFMLERKCYCDS